MNIFESAIGALAPGFALRRAVNRAKLDILAEHQERAYDGASRGRRFSTWNAAATDADAEISAAGDVLRQRARDLTRNSPHAAKAISVLADNIVGEGIVPRANTGNPTLDKTINDLFDRWQKNCDVEGLTDFYGKQHQAVREMVESGEVLARRVLGKADVTDPKAPIVGLQLQILESDFLDTSQTAGKGKGVVINGISFDANGGRVGYWLRPKHPGSAVQSTASTSTSKLTPADQVAHLFELQRTQTRGVTWLAPAMTTLRDLMDYESSELVRKKIEACVVAVVSPGDDDPNDTGIGSKVTDANGNTVERFEPGMIAYARGGKQIHFNNPSVSMAYEPYTRTQLRKIAAALRIPYEFLTNDLSDVNFSSARVGILEFRRFVRAVQTHYVIPMFCQKVWDWFILAAQMQGLIDANIVKVPVKWAFPKWQHINPIDDVRASILEVRGGLRSLSSAIAETGEYPDDVFAEIQSDNEKLDAAGIIVDSDPRYTTQQGIEQGTDPNNLGGGAAAQGAGGGKAVTAKKKASAAAPIPAKTSATEKPNGKKK